jgi:hypothetical protein
VHDIGRADWKIKVNLPMHYVYRQRNARWTNSAS